MRNDKLFVVIFTNKYTNMLSSTNVSSLHETFLHGEFVIFNYWCKKEANKFGMMNEELLKIHFKNVSRWLQGALLNSLPIIANEAMQIEKKLNIRLYIIALLKFFTIYPWQYVFEPLFEVRTHGLRAIVSASKPYFASERMRNSKNKKKEMKNFWRFISRMFHGYYKEHCSIAYQS